MKERIAWVVLIAFSQMLTSCAGTGGISETALSSVGSARVFEAKALPEVRILRKNKESFNGKLLRYGAGVATILPFPYWNVQEIQMALDDIRGIAFPEKDGGGGGRFLGFFSIGFLLNGALHGGQLKYNEDYSGALISAAEFGALLGFVALAIGSGSDSSPKGTILFDKLPAVEKANVILKIMGIDAPRP